MEIYATKAFENMYKGKFCYEHAKFTLTTFMNIPRRYTSPYQNNIQTFIFMFKSNILTKP